MEIAHHRNTNVSIVRLLQRKPVRRYSMLRNAMQTHRKNSGRAFKPDSPG
jgi:hypothetical protein